MPHPDDIVLNPSTGEAYINGPETEEDVAFYKQTARFRDHLLLQSVHHEKSGRTPRIRHEDTESCLFLFLASLMDLVLPVQYKWKDTEAISLIVRHQSLNKRERRKRVDREYDELKRNWRPSRDMTPEIAEEMERIRHKYLTWTARRA